MLMVSEGEGIQHACGQFEHAIDSFSPGEKKRKEIRGFFKPGAGLRENVARVNESMELLW